VLAARVVLRPADRQADLDARDQPVPVYPVKIEGDDVLVSIEESVSVHP
jgi:hypothetical protein